MTATNNRLVFSLQTARSEAIKRAVAVVLCPSENPLNASATCSGGYGDGWIVFEDADGNGLRAATEELILQTDASSPAFSITPDTVFEDRIFFNLMGASVNPSGGPLSGSILLDYQGGAQQRRVDVGASGRISTTVLSP
ncbi:MAG: GspH/FimT family protein [Granulosicoccus sp.]|nr:GspH/FimT family protein [Granulosicoccus sp.]